VIVDDFNVVGVAVLPLEADTPFVVYPNAVLTHEFVNQEGRLMRVRIGSSKDIAPGQMRAFDIEGTKVNVANVNGNLYAVDDTCTHMGCSLANGKLNGTTVTCPCHGSQFDVTSGAVIRGPAIRPVRSHAVKIEGEEICVDA
jgi:3-phenylpropionate/trans-cinnamate dioxygenase ferredoxin subunit